ncbi:MAG TPA: hypothetical protein DIC59_07600 [Candidatus Competibacteraceae bacterium]|nr:hypothetical protein [Candidatus Competibacteraceae bacterium]
MSEVTGSGGSFDAALGALRRYLMEKGNLFDRGPSYEGDGKVLSSVKQTVQMYRELGYSKLMEFGNPPVYAVLARGHREIHIFQPRDPKVREWLENRAAPKNDPAMEAYLLERAGLRESDLPVDDTPRHFHVNEVDDVFIASTDDPD